MRKIQKILIGVFVAGVLMGGVGTGIAFVEFSSFAYAGEKRVGEENLVTREFDHVFDPAGGGIAVDTGWGWQEYKEGRIIADASVPENVIRYEITYNEKAVRPYLVYEEADPPEQPGDLPGHGEDQLSRESAAFQERLQGRVLLVTRYLDNDLALWMECKDDFLQELKQKKISSYDRIDLADVKIRVNPATLPYTKKLSE